jgi:type IV pilus assembly protein PilY1
LAQINNFVDNAFLDNTTKNVYGGDNNGNIWRFVVNEIADNPLTPLVDESVPAHAVLLGTAKDSANRPQPITTRPELGEIGGNTWMFFGTGRLLGTPDLTDVYTQSVYGFREGEPVSPATSVYPDLRGSLRPLLIGPATAVNANPAVGATRTVACTGTATECARTSGWVVDLPDSGERVNIDLVLELGTLIFASNVPRNDACNIGGYSWINYLNFRTGLAVANSPSGNVSGYLGEALAVGLSVIRLPSGKTIVLVKKSDPPPPDPIEPPIEVPPPAGKRVSWREVVQ